MGHASNNSSKELQRTLKNIKNASKFNVSW
nr:MAG TPA: hypothetical protein [Caudoviricetes sp.]